MSSMNDEDSNVYSSGFQPMPSPPPPPPITSVTKSNYTGKARIIQSSVYASRDSRRAKARRKKTGTQMNASQPVKVMNGNDSTISTGSDPHARPAHMLSVVELCNNSEEDVESVTTTAIDTPMQSADEDGNETGDDGWADHNRWYCNICKDGGELLCCDRCPRAFHMSCLGMSDDMIPTSEWYCKMCSECLDRRRQKKESKEKARVMRETEKLERDARRRQAEQMREELQAKKSVEAIELKAKRILEMQDRILSRKKVKYKDKEEEKLGKLAEDLGKTVRVSKEKLEKLEKEDAALRRKEEALNKKKRDIDAIPREVMEDTSHLDKPTPLPCDFGDVPTKYIGNVLAIWDCLYVFRDALELAEISVDQFSRAICFSKHSPILTEIHLCLLERILEDREGEDYVSDDESPVDDGERYRYEVQHAPLTVGMPTRSMLTALTWPSILCSLIAAVPRYTTHATSTFLAAFHALHDTDYPELSVQHKLALLHFLVGRFVGTERVRELLNRHLDDTIQSTKEYNRTVLLDKKVTVEEEKKLREKQRAELARIVESNKTSVLDKAGTEELEESKIEFEGEVGSASDSDLDALAYNEEALLKNDEELEKLQLQDFISRHEYVARKNKLEKQRERLRQRMEVKQRKHKLHEQLERKRMQAKKSITDGLTSKDADMLRSAIDKGKECGLPDKVIVSARHVLEILDAEAIRERKIVETKRKWSALLRQSFVRTEPIGRDRDQFQYWVLRGDLRRVFVQKSGPSDKLQRRYESLPKSGSPRDNLVQVDDNNNATWYCYASQTEVNCLMEALDPRVPREALLRSALADELVELSNEMPVSKPGLLISDLLNEENTKKRAQSSTGVLVDEETEFLQWKNVKHPKRRAVLHVEPGVESFREELLKGQNWICKCLRTLGSTWPDRPENGGIEWRKAVQTIDKMEDFMQYLLVLESELMVTQKTKRGVGSATTTDPIEGESHARTESFDEKSEDEEDEEDEELLVDDGTMLWPSKSSRERWLQMVKRGKTVAILATALASLVHRLEVLGFISMSNEIVMKTRANIEKEKRSQKERAVKKKKQEEQSDNRLHESVDEWEEDCYLCSEGGELVCCDGCPHVFHYSCIGLRRVPRGKIFCHECDTSVNPVVSASNGGKKSQKPLNKRSRSAHSPSSRSRRRKQGKTDKIKSDNSDSEASDMNSESGTSVTSTRISVRQAHTGPKSSDDQWDIDCSVCGLGGELLCCDGCPRAFHVNCIGLVTIPETEWFCNECNLQTCGTCKKNKIRLDSHVICGSEDGSKGCDRVFHLKCAKLDAVPAEDWYCKKCSTKLNLVGND
ncbi:putative Zinc finger, FYVE/PHD-type, Zinc finger, RING/FYVE/PHD-type, methyltransferase, trithorax [Plasmopara halstedii]